MMANKIAVDLIPQGTLVERILPAAAVSAGC